MPWFRPRCPCERPRSGLPSWTSSLTCGTWIWGGHRRFLGGFFLKKLGNSGKTREKLWDNSGKMLISPNIYDFQCKDSISWISPGKMKHFRSRCRTVVVLPANMGDFTKNAFDLSTKTGLTRQNDPKWAWISTLSSLSLYSFGHQWRENSSNRIDIQAEAHLCLLVYKPMNTT